MQRIGEASTSGLAYKGSMLRSPRLLGGSVYGRWDEDVSALSDSATKGSDSFSGGRRARVVWQCVFSGIIRDFRPYALGKVLLKMPAAFWNTKAATTRHSVR